MRGAHVLTNYGLLSSPVRNNMHDYQSYEIYPELEEIFTERKEAFIEELAQHYGQDIPFIYEHCPDM